MSSSFNKQEVEILQIEWATLLNDKAKDTPANVQKKAKEILLNSYLPYLNDLKAYSDILNFRIYTMDSSYGAFYRRWLQSLPVVLPHNNLFICKPLKVSSNECPVYFANNKEVLGLSIFDKEFSRNEDAVLLMVDTRYGADDIAKEIRSIIQRYQIAWSEEKQVQVSRFREIERKKLEPYESSYSISENDLKIILAFSKFMIWMETEQIYDFRQANTDATDFVHQLPSRLNLDMSWRKIKGLQTKLWELAVDEFKYPKDSKELNKRLCIILDFIDPHSNLHKKA